MTPDQIRSRSGRRDAHKRRAVALAEEHCRRDAAEDMARFQRKALALLDDAQRYRDMALFSRATPHLRADWHEKEDRARASLRAFLATGALP